MSKAAKNKKNKVPKISEAEYAAYVSSIKEPNECMPIGTATSAGGVEGKPSMKKP